VKKKRREGNRAAAVELEGSNQKRKMSKGILLGGQNRGVQNNPTGRTQVVTQNNGQKKVTGDIAGRNQGKNSSGQGTAPRAGGRISVKRRNEARGSPAAKKHRGDSKAGLMCRRRKKSASTGDDRLPGGGEGAENQGMRPTM